MKNKLSIIVLIVLLGCDPIEKITGTKSVTKDIPAIAEKDTSKFVTYEGTLKTGNAVEIENEEGKDIIVFLKRGKTWVTLNEYSPKHKKKIPSYIATKDHVVFFHTRPTDSYCIQITQ